MTSLDEYISRLPADAQERIEAGARMIVEEQLRLAQLRKRMGLSQKAMAARLGVKQPRVSKLERGEDNQLSAMRSYVQALGGELNVTVCFPDGRKFQIETVADLEQVEV
ncbi:MAG: XRE family transcriptional regulator [Rhodospirillaceae bacterium]